LNIRNHATRGLLAIGVLITLPASLQADNLAYMLGTAAQGVENPFGTVDLNSGVFTLIGNMGSGDMTASLLRTVFYTPNRTDSFIRSTPATQISPSSAG
jgi:hypothetical protein